MNTMQLSCFVEVAAQLSFSKAAEALHVSQPTVSHQIKALEDELGCALLVRSTRSVRLTDDGLAFLEYANDILDLAARAECRLKHKQRPSSQQLRIGAQHKRARILSSAHSILSAAHRLPRADCSTSPATICHHSVSRQTARRAWRTLSVD